MASQDEAYEATMEAVTAAAKKLAQNPSASRAHAEAVRHVAEAYAWLSSPAQPHGGVSSSG